MSTPTTSSSTSTVFANIPAAATTIHTNIPILTADNWYTWSKCMGMFFLAAGIKSIVIGSASPSGDREIALDTQAVAYMFAKLHHDYWYLIEDLQSGKEAWSKLKSHFEKSTLGHRMLARQSLYGVKHDIQKPIDFYIQEVTSATAKLKALGCTVSDTEVIDVILMNLDPSFHHIRATILSQEEYPSLDKLQTILSSATSADILVPTVQGALATSTTYPRFSSSPRSYDHGSSSTPAGHHSSSHQYTSSHHHSAKPSSPVDSKGFKWCNPKNEGHCHRCGRAGHIAARCIYDMPQEVVDWVLASSHQNRHAHIQKANAVYHFLSSPPGSPSLSPSPSPPLSPRHGHSANSAYLPPLLI